MSTSKATPIAPAPNAASGIATEAVVVAGPAVVVGPGGYCPTDAPAESPRSKTAPSAAPRSFRCTIDLRMAVLSARSEVFLSGRRDTPVHWPGMGFPPATFVAAFFGMIDERGPLRGAPKPAHRYVVTCTANQCRSVMSEHLFRHCLLTSGVVDADVRSAGFLPSGTPPTERTVRAMAEKGFEVADHRSHQIGPWIAKASLVVTMTAEQAQGVIDQYRSIAAITFPLRDLLTRAERLGPRRADQTESDWLAQIRSSRDWKSVFDTSHDIADPTGGSMAKHRRLAAELAADFERLTKFLHGGVAGSH